MDEFDSPGHSIWVHISCSVYSEVPPRVLYEQLRRHSGEVFRRLAEHKESRIEEGPLMPENVHMMISIPPKHAVSPVVG
jgi:putative transposase